MEELTQHVKDLVECLGGVAVGIATAKTLEGGPPSSDLRYVLPEARSAIVFAVPLDQGFIEPFLKKEDHHSHALNNVRTDANRTSRCSSGGKFCVSHRCPIQP